MKTIHRRIANGLAKSEGGLLIALNAYGALLKREEESTEEREEREELTAMLKRVRELIVKKMPWFKTYTPVTPVRLDIKKFYVSSLESSWFPAKELEV